MEEQKRLTIDRQFVVNLHGREFVLVAGLLDLAHRSGLRSIETTVLAELCNPEKQEWVVQSIVRFRTDGEDAVWSALGDASPSSSQMRGAYLRHAETRAIARALRFATNVGMCSIEELGDEGGTAPRQNGQQAPQDGPPAPPRARHDPQDQAEKTCSVEGCGVVLNKNQLTLSTHHAKRPLCPTHLDAWRKQSVDQATGKT